MAITQLVTLDRGTLSNPIYRAFRTSPELTLIAADCYKFDFEPIVFYHALQLLSMDPTRYGIDVQDYLAPVIQYYTQHSPSQLTDLAFGTTDFKRRAAENLGVSIASLLMVKVLNVQWESITQIYSLRRQRGRRPDFVAYSNSQGYVFEAKGTSRPQNLDRQIKDATDQLKSFPLGGRGKIGFASFFPGEVGFICPSTHVFDPPLNAQIPNHEDAVLRHYIHKLLFLELNESAILLSDFVDTLLQTRGERDTRVIHRAEDRADKLKGRFLLLLNKEVESMKLMKPDEGDYLTLSKNILVKDRKVRLAASCHKAYLNPFATPSNKIKIEAGHSISHKGAESVFTDGTRISINW